MTLWLALAGCTSGTLTVEADPADVDGSDIRDTDPEREGDDDSERETDDDEDPERETDDDDGERETLSIEHLVGAWSRDLRTDDGTGTLWLDLDEDGEFGWTLTLADSDRVQDEGGGAWSVRSGYALFEVRGCDDTGVYEVGLSRDEQSLELAEDGETCRERVQALEGDWEWIERESDEG
jgi:hypothetical protein